MFYTRLPVSVLLPVTACLAVTGCQPHQAPPTTPALVFVDGQIQDSNDVIALTQRRVAASVSPLQHPQHAGSTTSRASMPSSVSTPLAQPALVSQPKSSGNPFSAPLVKPSAGPHPVSEMQSISITGSGDFPVVYLTDTKNLTLEQWINRIMPQGWKLSWQNAATPRRNTRIVSFSGNDQWHRVLNRLLTEQHLVGQIDMSTRQVTITTTEAAATREPAKQSTLSGTPPQMMTTPAVPTTTQSASSLLSSPAKPLPPRWTAKPGSTLRQTMQEWAQQATCTTGEHWRVMWQASVDYPVDAAMAFTGSWNDVLTEVFTLYGNAKTPLYATVYSRQCVVSVANRHSR